MSVLDEIAPSAVRGTLLPPPHRFRMQDRVAAARVLDVLTAVFAGAACHLAFAGAVGLMGIAVATGMQSGCGALPAPFGLAANVALLVQFPLLHSWLLSREGRRVLSRVVPGRRGAILAPTSYAVIASLQLAALFGLWTPSGQVWWQPIGAAWALAWTAFAGSWLFLLRAIADAGPGLQTGLVGWWALLRGRSPDFGPMPTRGLFRHCRQPIYLGFLLVLWTGPTWSPDHLLVALALTPYCILGPLWKERRFHAIHGEAFAAYRQRVPYFLPSVRSRMETES
jgi:protein-S-isoprenylcysteine O-methyltransferase Ste14